MAIVGYSDMTADRYTDLRAIDAATWQANRRRNETASVIYPALVGRVYANPTVPKATGAYFSVNPVSVAGTEVEAGSGILSVDGSLSFLVYVVGSNAPVAGEYLICRLVGSRWVAEHMGKSSNKIPVPGCPCLIPPILNMSVTHPEANLGVFQNAVFTYSTLPPELAPLGLGVKAFISTSAFTDNITLDKFWYRFFCSSGFFCISRVYATSIYGSPFSDSIRYRWLAGQPGNTCSPFLMTNGKIYPGGDPTTVVAISE